MDLKLVHSNSNTLALYRNQLEGALAAISPELLNCNIWSSGLVKKIKVFCNQHVGICSFVPNFEGIPEIVALELKLYWANLLSDPRQNSESIVSRRLAPMKWFRSKTSEILEHFDVDSISEIEHPEFSVNESGGRKQHNREFIRLFSEFEGSPRTKLVEAAYVKENRKEKKIYASPQITVAGNYHKRIVIAREQFKPVSKRNILFINELYSENNTRFKDMQSQEDWYLNFFLLPKWLRPAVKEHILQKISFDELGPKTVVGYLARMRVFGEFMNTEFSNPSPELITDALIEDKFVAWGNRKGLVGKNWFTDNLAMLKTASRTWPDSWPALSVSSRAARKIEKVHYKEGLGRIGHNQECANRAYSARIIDELKFATQRAPEPIFELFSIMLGLGIRAEDGHALLFNCLAEDPNDEKFMLLTFWQNKVRKWNVKPLLKTDSAHQELIKIVKAQQARVLRKHGKETKYLFPSFTGTKEGFLKPSYTMHEIKQQCVVADIKNDDGSPLSFSWHPLRHTKGTSLAKDGHDILSIMMELGHTSPDMATVYINNRLELKKKALMAHGGGRFYTIEGRVDNKISELLVRKDSLSATRVCGGACVMPAQIGDWCEHANACYTCKHYRADAKDLDFFKSERDSIGSLIEEQKQESIELSEQGKVRMSQIVDRRRTRNIDVCTSLETIIKAVEKDGQYAGDVNRFKQLSLEVDS
ncbi:MAG: tyrosine-type recombinase/integrase [Gammaproteobacteria bacterium]|nr:tyrosine-type recombinase/integrase [Gammaproteobacteria bacterium]